jgi:N-acetylglucosaminyl-diphospho-decaprenol L-rhamnosyltransferase
MTTPTRPRVDVGVLTYNTAELSATALRRLLDSDQGVELRLLVRDNASTDGTPEAVADAVPEAVIEIGSENLGFAAGVNRLLEKSDAPWFLALNSDAWPEPGAIAALVAAAESAPRAAATVPRIERPDGTLEHSTHALPSLWVAAMLATGAVSLLPARVRRRWLLEPDWQHDERRVVGWAVGAAMLMRREALDDLGGFDERFFMYAEDLEWCWRAGRKGWEIVFEPAALVRHVGNASGSAAYGRRRTAAYMRNSYRFAREAHGALWTFGWRVCNVVGSGRRWLIAVVRRRAGAARFWRTQIAASMVSTRGPDGPPRGS